MLRGGTTFAALALASGFSSSSGSASTKKHIYIVRHGEKIATPDDWAMPADLEANFEEAFEEAQKKETVQCLSEKGWARAYNLKTLFGTHGSIAKPDAVFSANYGEPLDCTDRHGWYRTQQTVSAVAADLGLEVDNTLGFMPNLCGLAVPSSYGPVGEYPKITNALFGKLGVEITPEGSCSPYGSPPGHDGGDNNKGIDYERR